MMKRRKRMLNRLRGLRSVRMLPDRRLRLTFSIDGRCGATRSEIVLPDSSFYVAVMDLTGRLQPGQIFLLEPLNGYQKLPPDPVDSPSAQVR
jgi:hypothetical protein